MRQNQMKADNVLPEVNLGDSGAINNEATNDFLRQQHLSDEMIESTLDEMKKNNITGVTKDEASQQFEAILDRNEKGQLNTTFGKEFTQGIQNERLHRQLEQERNALGASREIAAANDLTSPPIVDHRIDSPTNQTSPIIGNRMESPMDQTSPIVDHRMESPSDQTSPIVGNRMESPRIRQHQL